ncbi:hypothetical protein KY285_009438 [Solanum tuberosum]|nr:hypothetical protein KY285_009438 [Solanum tuberosum]
MSSSLTASLHTSTLRSPFVGNLNGFRVSSVAVRRVGFVRKTIECKESRIGKQPISVPSNVTLTMEGQDLKVKGPLGEMAITYPREVKLEKDDGGILRVRKAVETRRANQMHGLFRTLTDNMVVGVSKGFEKKLQLVGVGYRATIEGKDIVLNLGFSHPVRMEIPAGLQIKVEENTRITVSGYDKSEIGQFAASIRKWRPPEPYKGKGVKYADEIVRRKEGYTRDNPRTPLQERMMIGNVITHGAIENFSYILWPQGDTQFCDLVLGYSKKLLEFDDMVRIMVFEKLGLEKYLDEHKKSGDYLLNCMKYKVPKAEETNVGVPPHTDKIISTILSQHDQHVNGLQILDKNGQWLDLQYSSPHSYMFFVGDCLKAFTNGRLHSSTHRVIMGNEERFSMGFTTIPKEGYIIKVPEELVDEDHPLLYKPFDGSKYLPFYMSEGRRGVVATLESFCGVSANIPNLS